MLTTSQLTINDYPAYPIWKDLIYSTQGTNFSALDAVDFEVIKNGAAIFSGRAYKRPGDTYITIRLNDILSGLLIQNTDGAFTALIQVPGRTDFIQVPILFGLMEGAAIRVLDPAGSISSEVTDLNVFADWSRDYSRTYEFPPSFGALDNFPEASLNEPVSPDADARQYVPISTLKGNRVRIETAGGTSVVSYQVGSLNEEPRHFLFRAGDINGAGNDLHYAIDWEDPIQEDGFKNLFSGGRIKVRNTCARYCLYYLNALGGYDALLIQGKTDASLALSRETIERRGSTDLLWNRLEHRGKDVIDATGVRHLKCHTHWLTDDEAGRMWHLAGSPDVYVHDLEEDIVHPAVLTGTNFQEKTYRNQGGKLIQYTIELDYAVDERRR